MKKLIFIITLCVALLNSCSHDEVDPIMDYGSLYYHLIVVNTKGESVIDSLLPSCNKTFLENTSITVQGETFKVGEYAQMDLRPSTRAYHSYFRGMHIERYKSIKHPEGITYLEIGPFDSDMQWNKETITINWGDGTKDTFTFTSNYKLKAHSGSIIFTKKEYLWNDADSTEAYKANGCLTIKKNI